MVAGFCGKPSRETRRLALKANPRVPFKTLRAPLWLNIVAPLGLVCRG